MLKIAKKNSLTVDYAFCHDSEARFGVIESWYADILNGKLADYPPQVPYLFGLSVAWRMSVGGEFMSEMPNWCNLVQSGILKTG